MEMTVFLVLQRSIRYNVCPKEDKIMYQTCDMDGLMRVAPHAVFYIFHTLIGLVTTGTKVAPYLPAKALVCGCLCLWIDSP
jgi:hypothetical protein